MAYVESDEGDTFELTWTPSDPTVVHWAEFMVNDHRIVYGNSGADDVDDIVNVLGKIKSTTPEFQ